MSYSCLLLNTHPHRRQTLCPLGHQGIPPSSQQQLTYLRLSLGQALFILYCLPQVHTYLAQSAAQQDKVRRLTFHLGSATKMPRVTLVKSFNLICTRMRAQLCLTLSDPTDCSPPGSSVHGIFQARMLEWVAISFSEGSSRPRDRTCISCVSRTGRQCHLGKPSSSLG